MNLSSKDLLVLENKLKPIIISAGNYIKESWSRVSRVIYKNSRDVATNVDIEVEEMIRKELSKLLPEAGFIVEEGKSKKKEGFNWSIDPIDGTKNFVHLFPLFYVQVALLFNEDPILGIVYNPVSSQLFSASFLNGTKLNNELVKMTTRTSLNSAIIDIDFGGSDSIIEWKLAILAKLAKVVYRVRMTGGFGNTYMLTGAFDASIHIVQQTREKYIVDNAPRVILLKEAGFLTDFWEGDNNKKIFLASNPNLIKELKSIINRV